MKLYEENKNPTKLLKDSIKKRTLPSIGQVDHKAAKEKLAKLIDATDPKHFTSTNSTFASSLKEGKKQVDEDEHTKMIKSLPSFKTGQRRGVSQDMMRYQKGITTTK